MQNPSIHVVYEVIILSVWNTRTNIFDGKKKSFGEELFVVSIVRFLTRTRIVLTLPSKPKKNKNKTTDFTFDISSIHRFISVMNGIVKNAFSSWKLMKMCQWFYWEQRCVLSSVCFLVLLVLLIIAQPFILNMLLKL